MAAPMCTCLSYTRDSLLSMRGAASRLDRCTRKVLFSSEIWRPKYVRLTRTFGNDADPHCPSVSPPPPPPHPPSSLPSVPSSPGIRLATWNIHSLRKTGPPSCPICSHLHHAEPGLLRGRPFGMEWSPTGSPVTS